MADLRAENRSLRRQLARLRRDNDRLQHDTDEDDDGVTIEAAVVEVRKVCPKCGSHDLGTISTPNNKKVDSCRSCKKWRSKAY